MPVMLDNLAAAAAQAPRLTPKYFSTALTGSGKGTGLINKNVRPARTQPTPAAIALENIDINVKDKQSSGEVTTRVIPIDPLQERCFSAGSPLTLPVPDTHFVVSDTPTKKVIFTLNVQGIILHEDSSPQVGVDRDLHIRYRMEVHTVDPTNPAERSAVGQVSTYPGNAAIQFTVLPAQQAEDFIRTVSGLPVITDDLMAWLEDFDVYEAISEQAEAWAGDGIGKIMSQYIADVFSTAPSHTQLNQVAYQMRYLETYGVSLEVYREIYQAITQHAAPDIAETMCKQNLNLLMTNTLDHLDKMKPQLSQPPQASAPFDQRHFSMQQTAAITTDDPLVLVQSGAGTGKSSVILERINHLVSRGVKEQDITVLSFTNAAADNITEKNPNVGSMTIARMIHDIYNENYKGHELSSIDTVINSLDIFYPNDDTAYGLRKLLFGVKKNETGATTLLNTFVEKNFEKVMEILTKIKQTTLDLEIIICYQKIDELAEPAHVQSRYLIIDEVQDNSIFEFIYVLKYVAKHAENLYIVGDPSQTLYEFRSANPKALNALESSGVFTTYQLTTNYRSNQEILDFANVSLSSIEANQYAKIQLQANSFALPTAKSFQDAVTLDYRYYRTQKQFTEDLPFLLTEDVKKYADARLALGEKVAFLAYSRREVAIIENKLAEMYPGQHVVNLTSEKVHDSTVFSMFVKLYWNDIRQVPPSSASFAVTREIDKNLGALTRNAEAGRKQIIKLTSDWWTENMHAINGWVALHSAGQLSRDEFFDRLRDSLLSYEINHNAIKQSMINQRSNERKEQGLNSGARLFVSTIHGVKGLEFDNVVVVHHGDNRMSEDKKRMYYVAFTRAMNTEYILSTDTVVNARIESDYKLLVDALTKRDRMQAKAAIAAKSGVDPEDVTDEQADEYLGYAEQDDQS